MNGSNATLSDIFEVKKIMNGLAGKNLSDELNELSDKISAEKFYLVILELFKRGKSSFVNSLLGEPVAPSGVVPLTAIITLIEFGEEKKAEIFFEDGKIQTVEASSVKEYIAEELNPNNVKKVTKVVIYKPSGLLKSLTIIDTPGVGSSLEHNSQTTLQFVNKIDAAVFLLSGDLPISKAEVDFLQNLRAIAPKIFFVLNKIDLLQAEELNELINYNKSVLNNICKVDYEFFTVSSKLALEGKIKNNAALVEQSKILEVENGLLDLINSQKEKILAQSTNKRFLRIIEEAENLIRFKINSLKLPVNELDARLERFSKSLSAMNEDKEEFDILMEGKIKKLQEFVSDETEKLGDTLINNTKKDFAENLESYIEQIRTGDLDDFQRKYFSEIESEFDKMKTAIEKEAIIRFKNLLKKYVESSNNFLSEFLNNLTELTQFKFENLADTFNLDIYTGFYFNFSAEPIPLGVGNKNIRNKLPKAILKRAAIDKISKNIIERITANTANIKYDINYKIQESFLQFKFDLNRKTESVLRNIEKILKQTIAEKQKTEKELSEEIEKYEEKLRRIEEIKERY